MRAIKCVIIDDEASARDILQNLLLSFCDNVTISARCINLESGIEAIKEHSPDVVFLDIEMPKYAGYEIVKFFEEITFDIVFVTAYDKYALKAFEVSALDYLLKPIEIDRLIDTMQKIQKRVDQRSTLEQYNILQQSILSKEVTKIPVIHQGYRLFLKIDEIIAFEAQGSYCKIFTNSNQSYLVSKKVKYYEGLLAENKAFFRTHKSWIVNLSLMKSFSKSNLEVMLDGEIKAKLSRYRISEFEDAIRNV